MSRLRLTGLLAALCIAVPGHAGTPLPDAPHIVVSGTAKVSAKPDSVRLTFVFETNAAQPLAAKQAVDQNVNRLLGRLADFQIADEDIQAGSLRTSEDIDYTDSGRRVSHGFEASRRVTVLLKQVDRINDLIDTGLASGADSFEEPQYTSTQAYAMRREAKLQAVADARRKAEENAQAFGAGLGAIYSIDSITSRDSFGYNGGTLDKALMAPGTVLPGRYLQPSIDYTESVQAVFELKR